MCCGRTWRSPAPFQVSLLETVVALRQRAGPIQAMTELRSQTDLGPTCAQAIVRHLAVADGVCHSCTGTLSGLMVGRCPTCQAVNYDQSGATPLVSFWDGQPIPEDVALRRSLRLNSAGIEDLGQLSCLRFLASHWDSLPRERRGWAAWLIQRASRNPEAQHFDSQVIAAWFLESASLSRRPLSNYATFEVTQMVRPWVAEGVSVSPNPIFGDVHEIGLASFCALVGGSDFYLDFQWGGRFGKGLQVRPTKDGRLQLRQDLWIS